MVPQETFEFVIAPENQSLVRSSVFTSSHELISQITDTFASCLQRFFVVLMLCFLFWKLFSKEFVVNFTGCFHNQPVRFRKFPTFPDNQNDPQNHRKHEITKKQSTPYHYTKHFFHVQQYFLRIFAILTSASLL
jgi:hypothetical protein